MRLALVLLGLWLSGLCVAAGVALWFGLVGPGLVVAGAATAAVLFFGVDTSAPPPPPNRDDRRVPGL